MKYILNSPVLTNFGKYSFEKASLEEARKFVASNDFTSAVGHASTARLATELLGVEIPCNRISIRMDKGDEALVIYVKIRLEEGRTLNHDEILELYRKGMVQFGILKMES